MRSRTGERPDLPNVGIATFMKRALSAEGKSKNRAYCQRRREKTEKSLPDKAQGEDSLSGRRPTVALLQSDATLRYCNHPQRWARTDNEATIITDVQHPS